MSRSISVTFTLLAAALAVACNNNNTTSPTAPTPVSVTESFSGTLTVNGATTFPFTVQQTGAVSATLNTLSTDGAVVGLSLGTWNGAACQIIIANDNAAQGITVNGTAASTGNFCTRVYDVGKIAAPVDFTITVTHY